MAALRVVAKAVLTGNTDRILSVSERGEQALNWIIANQLGRRNLTPEQKSYLRGKRFNLEKGSRGGIRKQTLKNRV